MHVSRYVPEKSRGYRAAASGYEEFGVSGTEYGPVCEYCTCIAVIAWRVVGPQRIGAGSLCARANVVTLRQSLARHVVTSRRCNTHTALRV